MPRRIKAGLIALPLAIGLASCGIADANPAGEVVAFNGYCPLDFRPTAGENRGFMIEGTERWFHVRLPDDLSTPRPLFVAFTGTVQPEEDFLRQSRIEQLAGDGWIVVAPVRRCSQHGTNCSTGPGDDGRAWEPWFDATVGEASDDEGPDVRFVDALVSCVAAEWPVDANRIYNGGISAGGTFPYRLMSFRSQLFAGSIPASGTWYNHRSVPASPVAMDNSIVILTFGGETDIWPLQNPLVWYAPEVKMASEWFDAQPNVVTISCTGEFGHRWPSDMTQWMAETLLSHPKGTPASDFVLTDPPEGFTCHLGPYTMDVAGLPYIQ
jgi:poly(3-hydroxybutyrate) depolymerase